MDYGAHLATLIAVIVGLAVTDLLSGASRTLRRTEEAEFSWLPFVQAVMLAALLLVFWLASYAELSSGKFLSVWAYSTQLIVPALLYFAATRVFPPAEGSSALSVRAYASANARDVYIPAAIWMAGTMVENVYFIWPNWRGALVSDGLCLAAVIALVTAAFTTRDFVRWLGTIATLVTILLFMAMLLPATPLKS